MKQCIFSLYDRAVAVYGRPIFAPAAGAVLRELKDAIAGGQDTIAKHPRDFDLVQLGFFDDVAGRFDVLAHPELVLNCGALKDAPDVPLPSDGAPLGAAGVPSRKGNGSVSSVFPNGVDL